MQGNLFEHLICCLNFQGYFTLHLFFLRVQWVTMHNTHFSSGCCKIISFFQTADSRDRDRETEKEAEAEAEAEADRERERERGRGRGRELRRVQPLLLSDELHYHIPYF